MPTTRQRNKRKKGRSLKSALYYKRMAQIGMMQDDIRSAAENYSLAFKVDPADSKTAANLGNVYSLTGDFDKSLEYYLKARELGDTSSETAFGLVSVYQIKGFYSKALELVLEIKPEGDLTEKDIIHARTMCHIKLHDFEKASQDIETLEKEGLETEELEALKEEFKNEKELFETEKKNQEKAEKAVTNTQEA
jgi:tetratricopeptide (TPR) repeat protein